MRAALGVVLLIVPAVAGAGTLRGSISFPPDPRPGEARPLAYWRVENNLLPVVPAPVEARSEAIVVLEPEPAREPLPGEATIEARGMRLEPRVTVVALGSTIHVKNRDRVAHTFHLKDGDGLPAQRSAPGEERSFKIALAGEYRILDEEYPHVAATILVVRSSWFVHADDRGGFRIEAPDGKYSLRVFCRGRWSAPQPVEVGRDREVMVRLALPDEAGKKPAP